MRLEARSTFLRKIGVHSADCMIYYPYANNMKLSHRENHECASAADAVNRGIGIFNGRTVFLKIC